MKDIEKIIKDAGYSFECENCGTKHTAEEVVEHNANLHKAITATAGGIYYHPELRGNITDGASRNIVEMLKTLAEYAFTMGKEAAKENEGKV
jgi:phage pi2 protein 07